MIGTNGTAYASLVGSKFTQADDAPSYLYYTGIDADVFVTEVDTTAAPADEPGTGE